MLKGMILHRVGVARFRTLEKGPRFSDGLHVDCIDGSNDLVQVNNPGMIDPDLDSE